MPALCERVERRVLLAGDITFTDGTHHVVGDGTSNTVFVAEVLLGINVVFDGQTYVFPPAHTVDIDTGGGNDVVTLQGHSDGGIVGLTIDAGAGDDQVDVNFATGQGEAQPSRMLRVEVAAGGGADRVEIDYDNQRGGRPASAVAAGVRGGGGAVDSKSRRRDEWSVAVQVAVERLPWS